MWSKRAYVDFALKKRATIASMLTARDCPMCRKDKVTELQYVFGDQLGQYSGRIKNNDELDEMQSEYGEFRVYVVEVCLGCGWNHLTASYLLGDGIERKPPRKVKTR
ncbi:MAG: hypothetical protein EBW41_04985 [Actinobacteria bacterium]|nr:hypothetical protein [Actinomycetota bacterium]